MIAFPAAYAGTCARCDGRIAPGDLIERVLTGYAHAGPCPDDPSVEAIAPADLCPDCFTARSITGACLC